MNDLARHGVGERDVAADVQPHPHVGPLGGRGPARVDHVEPRAVPDPLQQVVEPDRVRRARVRSPQEDDVRLLDFAVGARASTRPEHRRQTDDARRVSCPVATVDVVGAERDAGELLRQEVHFVRGLRAAEDAERVRAARIDVAAEALGRARPAPRPSVAGRSAPLDADEGFGESRIRPSLARSFFIPASLLPPGRWALARRSGRLASRPYAVRRTSPTHRARRLMLSSIVARQHAGEAQAQLRNPRRDRDRTPGRART